MTTSAAVVFVKAAQTAVDARRSTVSRRLPNARTIHRPKMFKQLRRASKSLSSRTKRSASDARNDSCIDQNDQDSPFLRLPSEIRNQIYEYAAIKSELLLPVIKLRKIPNPPALLLTCRQIHIEFRPVLLANASITFRAVEYDFTNIKRVIEAQKRPDRNALRANQNLKIALYIGHAPTKKDRQNLLGWTLYRFRCYSRGGKIPEFEYEIRFLSNLRPPRPANRYMNGYHMRADLLTTHLPLFRDMTEGLEGSKSREAKGMLDSALHTLEVLYSLRDGRSGPPAFRARAVPDPA